MVRFNADLLVTSSTAIVSEVTEQIKLQNVFGPMCKIHCIKDLFENAEFF